MIKKARKNTINLEVDLDQIKKKAKRDTALSHEVNQQD